MDLPGRQAVMWSFVTAVIWLLIGTVFAMLTSIKLHAPDWLVQHGWLTFGRVRPAHLDTVTYGWISMANFGVAIWLIPRLVKVPLRWGRLALSGIVLWNIGVMIGTLLLLGGRSDGLEWLEFDLVWSDPWLVVGGGLVAASLIRTMMDREHRSLYVSTWYLLGALLWTPMLFVVGNLPIFSGVESAAVNWFYGHNAIGFWMTAVGLAAAYYFIPKVLGRPIYSYQLSLLGFWTFAFFYALNGMHHLIGGPLPSWMITTSIVASMMMVIPVLSVAINHHLSVVGRFVALRYSPTLRFVVIGAMAYTAVALQGILTSLVDVNRVTHFTQWTIAHSHVGLYAFVTMVLFGAIYYILPRLVYREWPSDALIRWHFWLALIGITLQVTVLTVGGVFQGIALNDPMQPFQASIETVMPYLRWRSMSGLLLTAAHVVFAYHVFWMLRGRPSSREAPPWRDIRPILVTRGGEHA